MPYLQVIIILIVKQSIFAGYLIDGAGILSLYFLLALIILQQQQLAM